MTVLLFLDHLNLHARFARPIRDSYPYRVGTLGTHPSFYLLPYIPYIYNNIFVDNIEFKNVILADVSIAKEITKAVITRLLVQIDRSVNISINTATIQIRNALALEFIVTKNTQLDKMLNIIDKMLVS